MNGQLISFLPDTSRGANGDLTVDFGTYFPNAVLVLKRTVFDGMKREEEEEITIEVRIKRLMTKTMAAATATTPRTTEEVNANVAEWKALGEEAVKEEPENYPYAACSTPAELTAAGFELGATTIGNDVCLISFDSPDTSSYGTRTFPNVQDFGADLPSLKDGKYMFNDQASLKSFTGKIPNVIDAEGMFGDSGLTSCAVALPNSLTNASGMFSWCQELTEWTLALPSSLVDGSNMFFGTVLPTLSIKDGLPNLVNGESMFSRNCAYYEGPTFDTWTVDLPKLENASWMFERCSGLTSWNVALPNSLTNVSGMFQHCTGLREFTPSLAGLTNCTDFSNMFYGCKLNEVSIRKVLTTLPDQTGKTRLFITDIGCDGTIDQATQNELGNLAQQISTERNYYISLEWNS